MKEKMNLNAVRRILFVFYAMFLSLTVTAQDQTGILGTVTDEHGEPVIGATVVEKAQPKNATITDFDGNFTLKVDAGTTIAISYVGYITAEVKAANGIKITLKPDDKLLEEVVVVGYGVQKKSVVTASIAKVSADDLEGKAPVRVDNALKGLAAGVNVTTSSGQPGASARIRIRGNGSVTNSDPLYIVDGMPIEGGIDYINPSDIESIEVLKDASSTAVYGSRGANGVVLVTTKKGKEGKVTLNYSGTVTFSKLSNVAEMMGAAEWLKYSRYAYFNSGAYGDGTPNYDLDYKIYGNVPASWANIEKGWSSDHSSFDY